MRSLLLALSLLLAAAGCDSSGVDKRGICLVGQQEAFETHRTTVQLLSPADGDTLRLGEPFRFQARIEAVGPSLIDSAFRLEIFRGTRFESLRDADVLYRLPLFSGQGLEATEIDREITIPSLSGGVTSQDLGPDEYLSLGLSGEIRFPVESTGGPQCGLTTSGTGSTVNATVTVVGGD